MSERVRENREAVALTTTAKLVSRRRIEKSSG